MEPNETSTTGTSGTQEAQVCRYSARHQADGVPAVTTIDCGVVGIIPACQKCADFYASMA